MRKTILTLAIIILSFGCTKDEVVNIEKPIQTTKVISAPKEIVLDSARVNFGTGTRDGGAASADLIFFRGSMTTDNYLQALLSNGVLQREHKIYDKNDVAYLQLSLGLLNIVNIDGVFHKHYKILVMYKDSTHINLVAYSKEGPDHFKYIPTGESLLKTNHPAKVVYYATTGQTKPYYNEFRDANYQLNRWQTRVDGVYKKADYKEPISKSTTQYQPLHSY